MILNKFSSVTLSGRFKTLSLQLIVLSLFSCNKTSNINANKSFVGLTHVAYEVGAINLTLNGKYLFPNPLSFGETTGYPGNPYDTTISQVSSMKIFLAQDSSANVTGNAAFRQGAHYSIFFFDTLDNNSVSLIILQDNPSFRTDTFTNYRFMNFSPGDTTWGLKLINNRKDNPYAADTVVIPAIAFVGHNNNPSNYPFQLIRSGNYSAFGFTGSQDPRSDTTNFIPLGDIQIDSLVNYYIYLQGFYGVTDTLDPNRFQLKWTALN
ncbi:MAG TPA: hypothetical protein VHQ04_09255 [Puia sp.]|nr:hypothetical protein [Puia sp.]